MKPGEMRIEPGGLFDLLVQEIERQDVKHGKFEGSELARSRLALACIADELREAEDAWRAERFAATWNESRGEVLQIAALSIRALRDAFPADRIGALIGESNRVGRAR